MRERKGPGSWPLFRQLARPDRLCLGAAVSRGRLCPKGSASLQLTTGDARQYRVKYRRPFGRDWEDLELDTAMASANAASPELRLTPEAVFP